MKWYLLALKKYDVLSGRASRKELGKFLFYNLVFILLAIATDNILGVTAAGLPCGIFNYLYVTAILIPTFAISIRRLHDVGKSGWFMLVVLIPIVGVVWLLVTLCSEGTDGENLYGEETMKFTFVQAQ